MADYHVPKRITKKELYAFLDDLFEKRVKQLKAEYSAKLKPLVPSILDELESLLSEADDIRQSLKSINLDLLYDVTGYSYAVSNLKTAVWNFNSKPSDMAKNSLQRRAETISDIHWSEDFFNSNSNLLGYVRVWNKVVEEYRQKVKEASQLRDELTLVVRNERKAPKAYKRLADIGLDMSVFEPQVASVPDIIRPSIDVNIFNNLKERTSADETVS